MVPQRDCYHTTLNQSKETALSWLASCFAVALVAPSAGLLGSPSCPPATQCLPRAQGRPTRHCKPPKATRTDPSSVSSPLLSGDGPLVPARGGAGRGGVRHTEQGGRGAGGRGQRGGPHEGLTSRVAEVKSESPVPMNWDIPHAGHKGPQAYVYLSSTPHEWEKRGLAGWRKLHIAYCRLAQIVLS